MPVHPASASSVRKAKGKFGCWWLIFISLFVAYSTVRIWIFYEREQIRESDLIENSRAISLMLFGYANDHNGKYPKGKTSTEVFQKLIDGGYDSPEADDEHLGPDIFYFPMPGKMKPTSTNLKPDNVCWDVTCCLDESSPDQTPLVFATGYKVNYKLGSSALPESWPARNWWEWLTTDDYPRGFIVVTYKSNSSVVLKAASDGSIPNFIPSPFIGASTGYRQLTPDGKNP
jgi:hypothetical protein